jgi:hypothetical protein
MDLLSIEGRRFAFDARKLLRFDLPAGFMAKMPFSVSQEKSIRIADICLYAIDSLSHQRKNRSLLAWLDVANRFAGLYGQYILDRKLVRQRRRTKESAMSNVEIRPLSSYRKC